MAIEPIQRINVGNAVFEQMKTQILSGDWAPGSKIPSENELTKMFGVSRMTVRSALYKLNILGLVHSKQGGGTYVQDFSAEVYLNSLLPALALGKHDLLEIQEFRRVFETETARLAALRRDDKDLERLNAIIGKMWEFRTDIKRFSVEDMNFHLELAKAAKNSLIIKVSQVTKDIFCFYMEKIVAFKGTSLPIDCHKQIYDAITVRDGDLAARIMAEHIDIIMEDILEKYPDG